MPRSAVYPMGPRGRGRVSRLPRLPGGRSSHNLVQWSAGTIAARASGDGASLTSKENRVSNDTNPRARKGSGARATTNGKGRAANGKAGHNGKNGGKTVVAAAIDRVHTEADGALLPGAVLRFDEAFAGEARNRLALNAVTAGKVQDVARNREAVVRAAQRTFSHVIKTPEITNQKQSGRCWMFAGLNVLARRGHEAAQGRAVRVLAELPACSTTSSRRRTTSSRR